MCGGIGALGALGTYRPATSPAALGVVGAVVPAVGEIKRANDEEAFGTVMKADRAPMVGSQRGYWRWLRCYSAHISLIRFVSGFPRYPGFQVRRVVIPKKMKKAIRVQFARVVRLGLVVVPWRRTPKG